ncbi:MAG: hypothetical protein GWN55_00370 [Phycisphaerae bacterium]|nr:hypothetical protein [Phycisphaerae bacterium]NIP50643.1 hypothetical protein [Phycisphaerae bacterium]NIS49781.1 hypothetical protein [Phycisphaerae bacterium]NIU99787.1 hypothetical protein [Phycisphaerae bacterium]NIW96970.1 hypothetical protein [Phycisphaerae bacterium]
MPQPAPLKTALLEPSGILSTIWRRWFHSVGQSGYVDRGDPSAYDWTHADLTEDGTWRDLDLSSIIPETAKLVHLRVIVQDDAASSSLALRENGNSNLHNGNAVRTQAPDIVNEGEVLVKPDKNRKIEYNATNTTWTLINIVVRGWFL